MADEPETPVTAKKDEPQAPAAAKPDAPQTPAPAAAKPDAPQTPAPVAAKPDEAQGPVVIKKDEATTPPPPRTDESQTPATARVEPRTLATANEDQGEAPSALTDDQAESAVRSAEDEHAKNTRVRRGLLLLSVANWAIALLAWTISAYLGITSPASIFVYTVLFVIGLFAATVAIATYILEKFAHRPEPTTSEAVEGDESDAAAIPSA